MAHTVVAAIEQLRTWNVSALQKKYQEVFKDASKSSNKQYLFRRIAWRCRPTRKGASASALAIEPSRLPTRLTSVRAPPRGSCRRRSVRRRPWTNHNRNETHGCPLAAHYSPVVSMTGRSS